MRVRSLLAMIPLAVSLTACRQPSCSSDVICETYVHRYGVEVQPDEWEEQGRSGQVVSMLKDGVTVTKTFSKGILDGDSSYTFPHQSNIQRTESYKQGILVKETNFYPSGIIQEEIEHTAPASTLTKTYFDQGSPRSVQTIQDGKIVQGKYYNLNQNVESGIEDGVGKRTNRDPFGQLVSIDQVQNGDLMLRTTYHPNGIPESQISYLNGVINGSVKTFMPAGDPRTIEQWKDGRQEGLTEVFLNGEKVAEVPYRAGVKSGVERRFSEGGKQVVEEVTWANNQQHGPSYRFVNGRIVETWYFQGQPVNKDAFDRLTGPRMH